MNGQLRPRLRHLTPLVTLSIEPGKLSATPCLHQASYGGGLGLEEMTDTEKEGENLLTKLPQFRPKGNCAGNVG